MAFIVRMRSLDEVLERCNRLAKIIGEAPEIEVRAAGEAQDLLERASFVAPGHANGRAVSSRRSLGIVTSWVLP